MQTYQKHRTSGDPKARGSVRASGRFDMADGLSRRALTKKLVITGAAIAMPAVFPRPLRAAEFTYKYANNSPASWPMNVRAAEAAERIKQETGGRLVIDI